MLYKNNMTICLCPGPSVCFHLTKRDDIITGGQRDKVQTDPGVEWSSWSNHRPITFVWWSITCLPQIQTLKMFDEVSGDVSAWGDGLSTLVSEDGCYVPHPRVVVVEVKWSVSVSSDELVLKTATFWCENVLILRVEVSSRTVLSRLSTFHLSSIVSAGDEREQRSTEPHVFFFCVREATVWH